MHPHHARDFPDILHPHDLAIMGEAYLLAVVDFDAREIDSDSVARMILKFYRKGLVDRHKLAGLSALAVARRLVISPVN